MFATFDWICVSASCVCAVCVRTKMALTLTSVLEQLACWSIVVSYASIGFRGQKSSKLRINETSLPSDFDQARCVLWCLRVMTDRQIHSFSFILFLVDGCNSLREKRTPWELNSWTSKSIDADAILFWTVLFDTFHDLQTYTLRTERKPQDLALMPVKQYKYH